ncbi:DUF4097 family beta strand repeat-containing protein [Pseudonocardia sp. HH130630-07]|uniref:DUF4097 family beta strand repeat-containing protein n=1 Tax=Pseudonocardia sp. HH130630-07 TaxID=1690815 RepID=UPI000814E826|nr:DUF4097 family beta strand repeat-containing protein [Pseudonocardia sp. HH130630-07]ANY08807.1 hypothetical protein AFB00_23905 [Pseudonocardia sp. HH130630-07]
MAALAAGMLMAGCAGSGTEQRETVTDRVDGAITRVEVDSDAGGLRLTAGEQASVTQELGWTGDARPEVEHRVEGGVLRITVRCPDDGGEQCQASLDVTVPAASSSRVELAAGGIEVSGLTGEQDLRSAAGSVRGTGLGPGPVAANSSAGGVDLTFAAAAPDVTAESSAGGVDVRVPVGPVYEVTTETSAGSVQVEVPDQPGADHRITAKSSAGSVSVVPAG